MPPSLPFGLWLKFLACIFWELIAKVELNSIRPLLTNGDQDELRLFTRRFPDLPSIYHSVFSPQRMRNCQVHPVPKSDFPGIVTGLGNEGPELGDTDNDDANVIGFYS